MNTNSVLSFIKNFQTPETIEVFTEGCCYWFAIILNKRFRATDTKIMYHPINNHFATRINGRLYDITGEINADGFWEWKKFANVDALVTKRIYNDCINKEDIYYGIFDV